MKEIKVAILGPKGTFTEIAAKKVFRDASFKYCDTIDDVFNAVESGADFGVVPMENSLEGGLDVTMDCLAGYDIKIHGEVILDICLCLIGEIKKKEIKVILSHPHALAQCRRFLTSNFPNAKLLRSESTASAMREIRGMKNAVAIGAKNSARIYGLNVIVEDIGDRPSQTRFIIISKKEGKGNKTSIIFAVHDNPGALSDVLKDFAKREINLKKIESRPSKRKLGEYLFFIDFEGSLSDEIIKDTIDSIKPKTTFLKILGSY